MPEWKTITWRINVSSLDCPYKQRGGGTAESDYCKANSFERCEIGTCKVFLGDMEDEETNT